MNNQRCNIGARHSRERGFSIIELSVALVIALFLLNGMFMILQNTRNASNNQNALSQLQDAQRMSITMLTDIIQEAGYFPGANNTDPSVPFPVSGSFTVAGQVVFGAVNTTNSAWGDYVTVRLQGDTSNGVLDCRGSTIASGTTVSMTYSIALWPGSATMTGLFCSINGGTLMPLISNVAKMSITYGVDVNSSGSTNAYLTGAQVTAGNFWTSVDSVKVALDYNNPLYNNGKTPGQTRVTLPFSRVINLMAKTGVNSLNFY